MSEKCTPCEVFVAVKLSIVVIVLIVMYARPSVRSHETSCVQWMGFLEISYCGFIMKLVEQIQVC